MLPTSSPWGKHSFATDHELHFRLGSLGLRATRRENDLILLETREEEPTGKQGPEAPRPAAESPRPTNEAGAGFRRFAFGRPVDFLELSPATPDRPLVLRPLYPLSLAPKAKVAFYVTFPMNLTLTAHAGRESTAIGSIRPEILSDTWFGDPFAGVLCYALKSRAGRERPDAGTIEEGRAVYTGSRTAPFPIRMPDTGTAPAENTGSGPAENKPSGQPTGSRGV